MRQTEAGEQAGSVVEDRASGAGEQGSTPSASAAAVSSMTGYARVAGRSGEAPALTLTLKSINHRFLDLQLRLPAGAEQLESLVRAELKRSLARGHVECTLTLDRAFDRVSDRSGRGANGGERRVAATRFDLQALRSYVRSFRAAAEELGLDSEPDLNTAARLPGMLMIEPETSPEISLETSLETSLELDEQATLEAVLARELPPLLAEAIAALRAMRAHEGAALAVVLREGLARLRVLVDEVGALRGGVRQAHYDRIAAQLDALVGGMFDRDRVLAEAALLAERGDVEEEVSRMHAHVTHFGALLDDGGETGKKLDFLLQEMNREANTLLSKTAGVTGGSLRITECGLAMKAEIEKLREQVQNLE